MRRLLLIATALWFSLPVSAWCYDLLIVQSQRSPVYDEVLRGLRSTARFSERVIVLPDYNHVDLQRIVREENPLAIVTLGDSALTAASKVRNASVISLMATSFRPGLNSQASITGVTLQAPPEHYLPLFTAIKARRVGVITSTYTPAAYIKQIRKTASALGVDIEVREVASGKEVSAKLAGLAGVVDAVWMLPDKITASSEAADAHFLFSATHRIPVVTFSSAYLATGAALALEFDRTDIGKQGGEMATAIINGASASDVPPQAPRKTVFKNSPSVLRRLGLNPDISYKQQ